MPAKKERPPLCRNCANSWPRSCARPPRAPRGARRGTSWGSEEDVVPGVGVVELLKLSRAEKLLDVTQRINPAAVGTGSEYEVLSWNGSPAAPRTGARSSETRYRHRRAHPGSRLGRRATGMPTAPARSAACARDRCRDGGRAGQNDALRGARSAGGVGRGRGCRAHRPWFGAPDCPGPIGPLGQFVASQASRGASAARLPAAGGRLREAVPSALVSPPSGIAPNPLQHTASTCDGRRARSLRHVSGS
jgi:hypothetical protein